MPPQPPPTKNRLHPRNRNRERYDLAALTAAVPELAAYVQPNKRGEPSVDFSDPQAVKLLNRALLQHYYGIEQWTFSDDNLCPPIPGRADYLHRMADLLATAHGGDIPRGEQVKCLDIGVGASCIYPILGVVEYGWQFIGSDIDTAAVASARNIVAANPVLVDKIELVHQPDPQHFFQNVLRAGVTVDLSICNPPFHPSKKAARQEAQRKVTNLTGKRQRRPTLNFAGNTNELVYPGGEAAFIARMITESQAFAQSCYWFSTLVAKKTHLDAIYQQLQQLRAQRVKTLPLGTGNKASRIVAWTFLTKADQKNWQASRWGE